MKRFYSAICTSLVFLSLSPAALASDDMVPSFWVGTLKQPGLDPTLLPILYTSESECGKAVRQVNDVAASTVGGTRKPTCQEVMINTHQLLAYVQKQKH
jgi:hypothetical protein